MTRQVLVTCDADSDGVAFEELRRHGVAKLPGEWLDTGDAVQGSILLVETGLEFERFSESLDEFGSIFIRHLAPVDYKVDLQERNRTFRRFARLFQKLPRRSGLA